MANTLNEDTLNRINELREQASKYTGGLYAFTVSSSELQNLSEAEIRSHVVQEALSAIEELREIASNLDHQEYREVLNRKIELLEQRLKVVKEGRIPLFPTDDWGCNPLSGFAG